MSPSNSLVLGISKGYQTMDLLAAFFFASTIIVFLRQKLSTKDNPIDTMSLFKYGLYASLVGAGLMSITYTGFIMLGAEYGATLKDIPPESLLAAISGNALGDIAMPIVSFTIMISCLATATVLANLFSEFIQDEISSGKVSYKLSILITMVISYALSLLGFQLIVSWIGWMLGWMYPLLIAYAIFKIIEGLRLRSGTNTVMV
jgi:branched-chain amino acid:cation transporter, LIVCS family